MTLNVNRMIMSKNINDLLRSQMFATPSSFFVSIKIKQY